MPGIIEFLTIFQQASQKFGDVFANEPERRSFAEYLTFRNFAKAQSKLSALRSAQKVWREQPRLRCARVRPLFPFHTIKTLMRAL